MQCDIITPSALCSCIYLILCAIFPSTITHPVVTLQSLSSTVYIFINTVTWLALRHGVCIHYSTLCNYIFRHFEFIHVKVCFCRLQKDYRNVDDVVITVKSILAEEFSSGWSYLICYIQYIVFNLFFLNNTMLLLNMPFLFICQQIKLQSIKVIIVLMHTGTDRRCAKCSFIVKCLKK